VQARLELVLARGAAVAVRAEDTSAEGAFVNTGGEPLNVDLVELSSPSLALEIVDERGRTLAMLPPPTPGRPEIVTVAPGERRSVPFRAFVPTFTPAGRYRVRLRYRDLRSGWLDLTLS